MQEAPTHPRDPLIIIAAITAAFAALCWVRLAIPSQPYFDELHYLPAAREWLSGGQFLNREHPPLGKQILAMGMALFGDGPLGWRSMPFAAGVITVFAAMRAMWFATRLRFATLSFGVLLATGFFLFIHARIAMLDVFMVGFLAVAAWHFAGAIREPETARFRLAATGIALGLAMASKWNAIPLAIVPGIAFFFARLSAGRLRLLFSQRGAPIPGMSLLEAGLWLGIVPLAVYALAYVPALALQDDPFATGGLIALHQSMLALQTQVLTPHTYQSNWPDWMFNLRSIWYLYEDIDGAQRGVVLIGNPLTMLLGLPALMWCLATGVAQRNWARLAMVIGYSVSLGLWMVAEKSVQFYYHYFLPSMFLLAALALALDALWRQGQRWLSGGILAGSLAVFFGFYPVLSAAALEGADTWLIWMWLDSWR
ncbi:MAG: glycosyltransferase family 39 protein [Erythrobacter sp.]